jgi:uncharacterized phage-associated protein
MKRVYITHGYSLAYLDRPSLDPLYDRVEAWKHGPVIPSVYHTFKHHGNNPIREKCIIMDYNGNGEGILKTPELEDNDIKEIASQVWDAHKQFSDQQIIEMLHKRGTPWAMCYQPYKNNEIPDLYTKAYYYKAIKITEARWKENCN